MALESNATQMTLKYTFAGFYFMIFVLLFTIFRKPFNSNAKMCHKMDYDDEQYVRFKWKMKTIVTKMLFGLKKKEDKNKKNDI